MTNLTRLQRMYSDRADRNTDIVQGMLALLRGKEPTGRAAIYSGCTLADFEILAHIDIPGGARIGLSTTSDWATILRDVFSKRLLDFYRAVDPSYRALARPISIRDFRPTTLLRVGDFPALERIGNGATIAEGYIADGGEVVTLLSLGRIFSLSEEAFTNNDVMGFNEVAELAANTVTIAENALFYATLLSASGAGPTMADGLPFFHASHGNLTTGSTLDATNLGLAMAALRKQTAPGEGAQKLNLSPRYVLCGPDNEIAARTAVASITPASGAPILEVLVDAHLSVSTGWYVFTSPDVRPAFVHGFLAGEENGPSIKARTSWTSEGPEWRVTRHVGVAPFDWRCAVRNPGQ